MVPSSSILQYKSSCDVVEMETKRKTMYHVHVDGNVSIYYVSPWRHHSTAAVMCFKKLKNREKYLMKYGDSIFLFLFFLIAKCEYSIYMWNKRMNEKIFML